jgi:dihydrofolate reductase
MNVTIDGCCDHTKGIPDHEVHAYFTRLTREADVLVYGRKTYELMVPFWPDIAKNPSNENKELNDFAQAFNAVPRIVVFSRTLSTAEEKQTTIVHENLKDEILKLKKENGKNILTGGVELPSQMMQLGLVDEIHLVVHPVVVGKGRRLFDEMNLEKDLNFKLAESKTFKSGCLALQYVKL